MALELDKQSILVTGAGGDLGRHLAVRLAQRGARLMLTDINEETLRETERLVRHLSPDCVVFPADLRDNNQVEAMVDAGWRGLGQIDSLVNMAGGVGFKNTKRLVFGITEEIWDEVNNINLRMHFFVTQAVARRMVDAGRPGRIVNIGSNGTKTGQQGIAHYGAAKAGLIKMTRDMAIELAPYNILVNAVSPGVIDTARMRAVMVDTAEVPGEVEAKLRTIPLARFGEPRHVTHIVTSLLEPDADYCTGVEIFVDGGFTLGVPMWNK